jgi:hypothetical protein
LRQSLQPNKEPQLDRRELRSHLRAQARLEFALERKADEAATRMYHERGRSLAQTLVENGSGATRITAHLPGTSFTGHLVHTAGDLLTLRNAAGTALHVRIGRSVILSIDRQRPGAWFGEASAPGSFIARLRQLELEARTICVITTSRLPDTTGILRSVASDHVVLDSDSRRWVMPIDAVVAIRSDPG